MSSGLVHYSSSSGAGQRYLPPITPFDLNSNDQSIAHLVVAHTCRCRFTRVWIRRKGVYFAWREVREVWGWAIKEWMNEWWMVSYQMMWVLSSFIHISIYTCSDLSIYPYIYPSIHPCTHIRIYQTIHTCIHPSIHLMMIMLGVQMAKYSKTVMPSAASSSSPSHTERSPIARMVAT